MKRRCLIIACLLALGMIYTMPAQAQLRVNGRFLVNPDGSPFYWIGDTFWCWEDFSAAEQDAYLNKRKAQGYTVIQTRVGGTEAMDRNATQWAAFDQWVNKITSRGMYAAVGIGWIINPWNVSEQPTAAEAYSLGYFMGSRYKDNSRIIWISADESTWPDAPLTVLNEFNRGIRAGDTGNKLLTVHPLAGGASSYFFTNLDFNAWQTGRYLAPAALPDYTADTWNNGTFTAWEAIAYDYNRSTKPVIDMEAWYEGAKNDMNGGTVIATAWNVRRRAYFTVLAGAFGHTYGAYGLAHDRDVAGKTLTTLLSYPGADDMRHLKDLISSPTRPFMKIKPDQNLITAGQSDNYDYHKQAARAADGSYAYVYSSNGSNFSVNLIALGASGQTINALWFDPRTGATSSTNLSSPYARVASQSFDPPGAPAADNDWVLILTPGGSTTDPAIDDPIIEDPVTDPDGVIDNTDAGFSKSGSWTSSSSTPGYYGSNYYAAAAGSDGVAKFTFTGVAAGTYNLYAQWAAYSNRATNATYTVTINGAAAASQVFNQQINGGKMNAFAATYTVPAGATVVVQIKAAGANGYVIADAVKLETTAVVPPPPPPPADETGVIDNLSAGFSKSGTWSASSFSPGYYGSNYYASPANSDGVAKFTFSGVSAGSYKIYAQWAADSNRATNATYTVTINGAAAASQVFNQQINGGKMNAFAATYTIPAGATVVVQIKAAGANGYVIADAVQLALADGVITDPTTYDKIMDNVDSGFTKGGTWTASSYSPGYYGSNYLSAVKGSTAVATYTFTAVPAGTYKLYAQWSAYSNRATNATYTVKINGAAATSQVFNQQINGGKMNAFAATYTVPTTGTVVVEIKAATANGYLIADAVRLQKQ